MLDDHINLLGDSPLVGPNVDEWGPRFPDMSQVYDLDLQERARAAALSQGIPLHRGVYVAVTGPNLETRAEYRMLRAMGGDVVGMSTVPEALVARQMGMRILAITVVTDHCLPDALEPTDVQTIIRIAGEAEPRLTAVFRSVLAGFRGDQ
jgi:purine-nucleoside phosphorylase